MQIRVKRVRESAKLPTYAHPGDAGMDLYAAEETTVPAGNYTGVPTGIAFAIPDGYVGLVWDKSGLARNHGITTLAGVIDAGYRGELQTIIVNTSHEDYTIKIGDKVAQLLIQPVEYAGIIEVEELPDSERGEGGFGSTGK